MGEPEEPERDAEESAGRRRLRLLGWIALGLLAGLASWSLIFFGCIAAFNDYLH